MVPIYAIALLASTAQSGPAGGQAVRMAVGVLRDAENYYKNPDIINRGIQRQANRRIEIAVEMVAARTSRADLRTAVTELEQNSHNSVQSHQIARILFDVVFNDAPANSPLAYAQVDVKHGKLTWPAQDDLRPKTPPMYTQWETYKKRLGFRPIGQIKALMHNRTSGA